MYPGRRIIIFVRFSFALLRNKPSSLAVITSFWFTKDESNIPSSGTIDSFLPVHEPYWNRDKAKFGSDGIRATWLGHASVLAEIDESVVITDPIFRFDSANIAETIYRSFISDRLTTVKGHLQRNGWDQKDILVQQQLLVICQSTWTLWSYRILTMITWTLEPSNNCTRGE